MNVFIIKQAEDGGECIKTENEPYRLVNFWSGADEIVLEFITMSLENGIVLPGVTRDSIIEMLRDHGSGKKDFPVDGMPRNIRVVERDISMREITTSLEDGSLKG